MKGEELSKGGLPEKMADMTNISNSTGGFIIIQPTGGLCNRMRAVTAGLSLAHITNKRLSLIWREDSHLNCSYNKLFKSHPEILLNHKEPIYVKSSIQHNKVKHILAKLINKISQYDIVLLDVENLNGCLISLGNIIEARKIYINTCHEFFDFNNNYKIFSPIEEISNKISEVSDSFDDATIGVHIRRGDNRTSFLNSPLSLFITTMKNMIESNGKTKYFLTTDSPIVETELKKYFGIKRVITHKKVFTTRTEVGVQDSVVDLFCLARTRTIVGSYGSSFTETAAKLGGAELIILKN
ncbi:MAG: hypothetical protein NTW71_13730 [Deltaproteobacteria bacterium]|nr:hypothetical protein [Deltaproteobacteria bacterium]